MNNSTGRNNIDKVLWGGLALILIVISVLIFIGPAEKTLGTNVRAVYLHGALVWTAILVIGLSAVSGFIGIVLNNMRFHHWSLALGRTGILFWLIYLPVSLWTMQANWNGLFLAEPRWRMALSFAFAGILIQVGLAILRKPRWSSFVNIVYALILFGQILTTEEVMHPSSPILTSQSIKIRIFFLTLTTLTSLTALITAGFWVNKSRIAEIQDRN